MRFAHISDTHLGFRQYGLSEREDDFYHAFDEAIRKILQERPDFVIHAGDLFDMHRPQPKALFVAQRGFSMLRDKGIPVYAITGNHDVLMRRGSMPPHVLFRDFNVRLLTEDSPFHVHEGVFIGGIPYTSKYYSDRLKESLGILARKAGGHGKSILVMHQGIDTFLPQEYEVILSEMPKGFDYYALGHVHSRIVHDFGKGKLVYPGSTELWSANEYDDMKRRGKGFHLVDLGGDEPAVQAVDLELRREIIRERVAAAKLDEWSSRFREALGKMAVPPLVYVEVKGGDFDRKALHDRLLSQLSELALSLRVGYSVAAPKKQAAALPGNLDVAGMIAEAVKDKAKANFAVQLFRTLSEGSVDEALAAAEDYYGGDG